MHPGKGQVPLTLSAGKNALALHVPRWLRSPLGDGVGAGVEDGLPSITLGLYLKLRG